MANLVSDLITEAFISLGVVQPGGTPSSALTTDAFLRLNQMYASWGTNLGISNAWYHQSLTVLAGTSTYTFGTGGTLVATATPVAIIGAESVSGNFRSPVKVVSFKAFDELVQDAQGSQAVLANLLAADNAFPSINLRVFPVPAATPGSLLLDYFGVMAAFSSTAQSLSLAPEFELALYLNLAVLLYPTYARANWDPAPLFAQAAAALQAIQTKNAAIHTAGLQAPPQAA